MRNAIVLLVVLLSAIGPVAGCKDRGKGAQPKPSPGSAAAANDAAAKLPNQNELRLPKLTGTPPVKTTKPIDTAKAETMSKQDFDGFNKDVRLATELGLEVRYTTAARPHIMVTVNATKCFDCLPMELDKWKAKLDSLKVLMGPELKDLPDTTFELGMTEMASTPYLWTYHVGHNINPDPGTGIAGAYGTAYAIHWNDGVNQIRVVAEYKDDVPKTREDMVNLTPKEDLETIAKAFMDVFVHLWG